MKLQLDPDPGTTHRGFLGYLCNDGLSFSLLRVVVVIVATLSSSVPAQEFDEKFEHWPLDLKINGKIIMGSDLRDMSVLEAALPSDRDQKVTLLLDDADPASAVTPLTAFFAKHPYALTVRRLGPDDPNHVDDLLKNCDIFCLPLSQGMTDQFRDRLIASLDAFHAHIAAGKTIIATGWATELLSAFYRETSNESVRVLNGLNLVPDCVLETRFEDSVAGRGGLLSVLALHPGAVGIGIEKNTALVLDGRKMRVLGQGKATFLLMANERQPLRVRRISSRRPGRRSSGAGLIDLTQWRRDAIDRTLEPFPPSEPRTPFVGNGTLVIAGGGGLPRGLMARFVELAGGPERARLVYVPCSENDVVSAQQGTVQSWKRMGVRNATFIHTKDRNRANSDEKILAPLREATGIWFGGGRQWNFADSYYGTEAHRLMKDALNRGGVVGGSSAGASIQARYLARATPIGNLRIMAPGYERGGLGFISGVAIDQHFSQRNRQKDMSGLVNRYPQLLGIGIDEGTALIVQKSIAQVVGRGQVYFYDRRQPLFPDRPDYVSLSAGSSFDLALRKEVIEHSTAEAFKEEIDP